MKFMLGVYIFLLLICLAFMLYILGSTTRAPDLHPSKPIAQLLVKKSDWKPVPSYLGWQTETTRPVLRARPKAGWTQDERFAWKFSAPQDAVKEAQRLGAEVVYGAF